MSGQGPASEGAIQPIGFLVALAPDWRVSRASANIGDYLGTAAADLLDQPITGLFAHDAIHSLRNRLALLRSADAVERLFSVALTGTDKVYDVALHMCGTTVVIEAEPSRDHRHDRDSMGTVRGMIAQLAAIDSLPAFFGEAARHLRALTGFDRVTIERRRIDGSVELAGEAVRSAASAMTGTPIATDSWSAVPSTTLMVIPDTSAASVAIVAPQRGRHAPLDLSNAMLQAALPERAASLRATGIGAALLLPLTVAGRRWGEIACYHRTPSCPSFERRSAIEWFALMLAMQIEIRELKAAIATRA